MVVALFSVPMSLSAASTNGVEEFGLVALLLSG